MPSSGILPGRCCAAIAAKLVSGGRHATPAAALDRFARDVRRLCLQGAGHVNLYQLFFERALALLRRGRPHRNGCLPSGFALDKAAPNCAGHILEGTQLDGLVSVENREAIFPIHRGLKFLLLTATEGGSRRMGVTCRFGDQDLMRWRAFRT